MDYFENLNSPTPEPLYGYRHTTAAPGFVSLMIISETMLILTLRERYRGERAIIEGTRRREGLKNPFKFDLPGRSLL